MDTNSATNKRLIVQKLVERYKQLQTYEDTGTVEMFRQGDHKIMSIHFLTYFRQPNLFRFEFVRSLPFEVEKNSEEYAVGFDGKASYIIADYRGKRPSTKITLNLEMAIASAMGISFGSVTTVLGLLIPQMKDGFFNTKQDKFDLSETNNDGQIQLAWRIVDSDGDKHELRFRKDDHLITFRETHSATARVIETRQNIFVNRDLSLERFSFR